MHKRNDTDYLGRPVYLPWNQSIPLTRNGEGYNVRRYTDVGCYPLAYFSADGDALCPACVEDDVVNGETVACEAAVIWEGEHYCAECSRPLETAYNN